MLALQLLCNGIVTGCALGIVAVSFSFVYATTKIFHVAHAGVYTAGGYIAWAMLNKGFHPAIAFIAAILFCTALGAAIQAFLYARLERRRATHLVVLIASLGTLAVIQNILSGVFTANILQFNLPWGSEVFHLGGNVRLTMTQILTVLISLAAYAGVMYFSHGTILGKQIRAVASNPFLAEITRLHPHRVHIYVVAIASALVCLPGILVPMDFGLQPYNGVTPLLTATIAMIAGGVGSITGAFVLAIIIAELQNMSLLLIPGEWSIGVTFFIFVIFMLFRPTGLFAAAR
jgi:branched-chain amino acid transport system permease protein